MIVFQPNYHPATKAEEGHDEDISREEIIKQGMCQKKIIRYLKTILGRFLNAEHTSRRKRANLGRYQVRIWKNSWWNHCFNWWIHPDSSRYFYAEGYEARQKAGEAQKQLSKEFVRQWLISNGFQGLEGQSVPEMSEEYIETVSNRYIELYENITGESFVKADLSHIEERIEQNILHYLANR